MLLSMLLLNSVMLTHMFVLHEYCAFQAATARPTVRRTAAPRRTARPTARRTALPTAAATTAATAAATAAVTTVAPSVAPTTAANDTATTTTEFYTVPLTTQFVGQTSAAVDSLQQAAFSAAVLAVAAAANKGLNPDATDPTVTILSVTESAAPATRRHLRGQPLHRRHLQAAADAVVSYEVQRLSGQAAATAVGQQLAAVSTDGSLLAAFKAQAAQRGVPAGAITAASLLTTPGYVASACTVSLLSARTVDRTVHRYACSGSVARPSHSTVISATHKDFETSFTQQSVLICDVSYMRNTATALPLIHKHCRNLRQEPVPPAPKKKSTPTGLIVGVVVGCAVLIGLLVAAALLCYRRKNKRKHAAAAQQQQQQQQQLLKAKDMSVGHSGVSTSSTTSRAPVSAVGGKRGATAVVPDIEHGGIIKNSSSLSTGNISYGNGGHGNGDYDSHDEGTDAGTTAAATTAAAAATAVPAAVAMSDYSKKDLLLMQQQQQQQQKLPITATPPTATAADVPMSDYSREEYLLAQHEQQQQQQQREPLNVSSRSSSGQEHKQSSGDVFAVNNNSNSSNQHMSDYSYEDHLLLQQQQRGVNAATAAASGIEQPMSDYSKEDLLLLQQQQQQQQPLADVQSVATEPFMSEYSQEDLLLLVALPTFS
jgi:hypothetical protein